MVVWGERYGEGEGVWGVRWWGGMNCNMLDSSAVDALHKGDHAAGCRVLVFFFMAFCSDIPALLVLVRQMFWI